MNFTVFANNAIMDHNVMAAFANDLNGEDLHIPPNIPLFEEHELVGELLEFLLLGHHDAAAEAA